MENHGKVHLQMEENWGYLHDFGNLRMAISSETTCPIPSLAEGPTWQRPSGMTWCRHRQGPRFMGDVEKAILMMIDGYVALGQQYMGFLMIYDLGP